MSAGGGDNMMGAIGTGNVERGRGHRQPRHQRHGLRLCHRAASSIRKGEIAAFCDRTDRWLPLVCTMNVTVATEQVRKMFGWTHRADGKECRVDAPAGADGLAFPPIPQWRTDAQSPRSVQRRAPRADTENMAPAYIARAAMEGATLGLAYGLNRFRELGIEPTEIRLTGGGSKSAVWRQICADIFGVPTVCLQTPRVQRWAPRSRAPMHASFPMDKASHVPRAVRPNRKAR